MNKISYVSYVSILMAVAIVQPCVAQTQRSGNDSTRIVQQLQQVTADKARLQQDNDSLKKELDEIKARFSQAGADLGKAQQRVRQLESASSKQPVSNPGTEEALEKSKAQLQELIGKFRETAQSLKDAEVDRDGQVAARAAKERELSACVDKNAQMYLLSTEVLDRMEGQGVWSAMKAKEPFTRLSRTRLENLIDDYRSRVNELKLANKSASAATP